MSAIKFRGSATRVQRVKSRAVLIRAGGMAGCEAKRDTLLASSSEVSGSGGAPVVSMMTVTDIRDRHDGAVAGRRDRTRNRRVFVQRQVRLLARQWTCWAKSHDGGLHVRASFATPFVLRVAVDPSPRSGRRIAAHIACSTCGEGVSPHVISRSL